MLEISIVGAKFYAYHGVYPEEKLTGNNFSVDVTVSLLHQPDTSDKLSHTIDYAKLYNYCAEVMKEPADLLETVAGKIFTKISLHHPEVHSIEVTVSKYNPAVGGPCDLSRVKISNSKQ